MSLTLVGGLHWCVCRHLITQTAFDNLIDAPASAAAASQQVVPPKANVLVCCLPLQEEAGDVDEDRACLERLADTLSRAEVVEKVVVVSCLSVYGPDQVGVDESIAPSPSQLRDVKHHGANRAWFETKLRDSVHRGKVSFVRLPGEGEPFAHSRLL